MKKYFILLFILFLTFPFIAEDTSSKDWKSNSEKFRLESLAKDIVNADFYQLKSMALSLGLPEQSNSAAYRRILANYYKIKLIEKKESNKEFLNSSSSVRYFVRFVNFSSKSFELEMRNVKVPVCRAMFEFENKIGGQTSKLNFNDDTNT